MKSAQKIINKIKTKKTFEEFIQEELIKIDEYYY
jgi:hypothetical protein